MAYAQSFALWQQATIEFTCHDHSPRTPVVTFNRSQVNIGRASTPRSLFYCLFAPHVCMVLFFTHISFVVNHTINATLQERLQQYPKQKTFTNYYAQLPSHNKQLCPWEVSSLDDSLDTQPPMNFTNRCTWQRCTRTGGHECGHARMVIMRVVMRAPVVMRVVKWPCARV